MAKFRLRKFNGTVIAVTGSVGKTSTKEAIFSVLNSQLKVKKNKKSMNSEFGLLLTILDIESGFSSVSKWSWFLLKAFYHCFFRDHSEVLLLEMGVDKPGDMDFLLSVVKPDIAIMTNISPIHMNEDQFKDLQDIFDEKKKLVESLKDKGIAVLNIDNPFLEKFSKSRNKTTTYTYGKTKDADFYPTSISQSLEGLKFMLHYKDKKFQVNVPVLGEYHVYVIMPALICSEILGLDPEISLTALERFSLPPGRMTIIPAKNGATILDSSYNSSPEALKEALKVLKIVGEKNRKVAVLGNMNELGDESQNLHEMIGEIVPGYVDMLLTVGSKAKHIAKKAEEKGLDPKNIHSYKNASEAAEYFKKKIEKNDLILVKGSQNKVRLEKFVKKIMANPDDAKKLLVRQEKVWEAKL